MRTVLIHKYISEPRYERYLIATSNHVEKALHLYKANIKLAQSFYAIISQFEVVLRNSINNQLSSYFEDGDWIISQRERFMSNVSLARSHYFLKNSVEKSIQKFSRSSDTITSGKVISDQSFGFWSAFYLSHHFRLLRGQPLSVFTYKPRSENRSTIYRKLVRINLFRNRVSHCEPLCFVDNHVDCSSVIELRNITYDLINWIEPELESFFLSIDDVLEEIDKLNTI